MIGRHRVTLQAITPTETEGGGWIEAPTDIATVRGSVESLDGFEQISAMQAGMTRSYRITGWYRGDVTGATRAIWHYRDGDHTLNIRSVVFPRRRKIQILADEVIS